jgi:hypothetical protein
MKIPVLKTLVSINYKKTIVKETLSLASVIVKIVVVQATKMDITLPGVIGHLVLEAVEKVNLIHL